MEDLSKKLRALRSQYMGVSLDKSSVDRSPFHQFKIWMEEAVHNNVDEPTAMTLGTATADGRPSLRVVLLKEVSEKGFVFYTNYNSKKGKEINENPHGSVLFFWSKLHRQIRIEGVLEKISPAECEKYFKERPVASQVSAWVSPQSSEVENKSVLEQNYLEFESKYSEKEIPYPPFWGGYCLKPVLFEFWQGQPNRLHDRVQYKLSEETGNWEIACLAP